MRRQVAIGFTFVLMVVVFYVADIYALDWYDCFGLIREHMSNPYEIGKFVSPAPLAFILAPFSALPPRLGNAINQALLVTVTFWIAYSRSNLFGGAIAATSLPLVISVAYGSTEWVQGLVLLGGGILTPFLLSLKPQVMGAYVIRYFAQETRGNKVRSIGLALIVYAVSFAVWGNWLPVMVRSVNRVVWTHNLSVFPFGIPLALLLMPGVLYGNDGRAEILSSVVSLCLAPYFSFYSLTIPFALIAARNKCFALLVSVGMWAWVFSKGVM